MPNLPIPDETPAWIKGDLPTESSGADAEPNQAVATEHSDEPNQVAGSEPSITPADASQGGLAVIVPQTGQAFVFETPEGQPPSGAMAMADATNWQIAEAEPAPSPHLPTLEAFQSAPSGDKAAPNAAEARQSAAANPELAPEPEQTATAAPVLERLSLEAQIESLLFVADGAVAVGRLAEALEVPSREVEAALTALGQSYRQRGLSLQRFRDKVQLTTSPSAAAGVERFLGLAAASPLSRAALETLAIVGYQQPVTRPQIEAIRGVNSDSVMKNLLSKGLIEESGRTEGPGRPVLYSTTSEFMQHFGLASLSDLPPLSLPKPDSVDNPGRVLRD